MKRLVPAISMFVVTLLLIFIYYAFIRKEAVLECDEATGTIEATEVSLSPKIPGKIVWLCCKEGEHIQAGQLAIKLDDRELKARVDEGRAALKGAGASVKLAEVNLENSRVGEKGARAEVQAAEAEVTRIKVLAENAKKNLQRTEDLFKNGLLSERDMDDATAEYDAFYAQLNSAAARKIAADAALNGAKVNIKAAEAQISSAKTKVQEAKAVLNLLKTQLDDTRIHSPTNGVVAYKAFEIGETVGFGVPVYTIHDLNNIWARVDIEETLIGNIRLGNKAAIKAAALPDKVFEGEVIEIGKEGEFATQRDVTRGRPDIRTFRVKVGIKAPDGLLKSGMTVKVKIVCE